MPKDLAARFFERVHIGNWNSTHGRWQHPQSGSRPKGNYSPTVNYSWDSVERHRLASAIPLTGKELCLSKNFDV
jgi:hypothetical protein